MPVDVNHNKALDVMRSSLNRVKENPVTSCLIASEIDTVLQGKNVLTYKYMLLTALVAKATNPCIDILSLQVDDSSAGAYAPRTLCSAVVYPFQLTFMSNVLDGSNSDPFVNKPARYKRMRKDNAARGDGRRALVALVDGLPRLDNPQRVIEALDYLMSRLVALMEKHQAEQLHMEIVASKATDMTLRTFLNDLLDQGFGGAALLLAATMLYRIQYPASEGYEAVPHPVNQSGASSKQFSDLDLYRNGAPYLATELKDKNFTAQDVKHAADTALESEVNGLLFIAGRMSGYSTQPPTYFTQSRNKYASKGIYLGILGIDAFMDLVLATHHDIDCSAVIKDGLETLETIGATPEMSMWCYETIEGLTD